MEFITPFGPVSTDPKPLAPTKKEVAENPGKYDGTSFDPMKIVIPQGIFGRFSDDPECESWVLPTFKDWLKQEKSSAFKYFKNQFGFDLAIDKLSDNQKKGL